MYLPEPLYRKDYQGEVLTKAVNGAEQRFFVKSRNLFHRTEPNGRAMVIGNGMSRQNDMFNLFMKTNSNRPIQGYKIVYGCNGAAWDLDCDYYVITNRAFLGSVNNTAIHSQFVMPWTLWTDNKNCHLVPLVNYGNAGTLALYLACFDGNEQVFMFGFDLQDGTYNNNCYAGREDYDAETVPVNSSSWVKDTMLLMASYPNVQFYRVGGGSTPLGWQGLTNFKDITYRDAVMLGDF